jgi:hypothetical protein
LSISRFGSGTKLSTGLHELLDRLGAELAGVALERLQRRAADDRRVVAREVVLREQLAHFELDEIEELLVLDHVDLVHEDDDGGHADLTGEQDVLAGLRHGAVGRRDDEDRAVHLRRAGDHVLDVVGVAGAIDVGVVALVRLVLDVRGRDGDAAFALFGRLVDLIERHEVAEALRGLRLRDRRGERGLPVVDVTDRPHVDVGLLPLELRLAHEILPPSPVYYPACEIGPPPWRIASGPTPFGTGS